LQLEVTNCVAYIMLRPLRSAQYTAATADASLPPTATSHVTV